MRDLLFRGARVRLAEDCGGEASRSTKALYENQNQLQINLINSVSS